MGEKVSCKLVGVILGGWCGVEMGGWLARGHCHCESGEGVALFAHCAIGFIELELGCALIVFWEVDFCESRDRDEEHEGNTNEKSNCRRSHQALKKAVAVMMALISCAGRNECPRD